MRQKKKSSKTKGLKSNYNKTTNLKIKTTQAILNTYRY